ncbi:lytic transglycosylase [Pseudoruegeria sp. SHC-113]|uniref:transglycosylase SLT domain-containing protein n=1 Tax=Pseudoruegeria sp. SHC-113 TaxID=2855439 RepID=UPI0021BA6688|nr:lytic transglycosylase [Pseudoruegeria sp. SHC-113]MCT8158467.1 lytic transglycosylase [Pseudoruegeria sp. SHC-113]
MKRVVLFASLLVVLAACGGPPPPPRNLNDACSIVKQYPKFRRSMKKVERKYGVPINVQMATIYQESKFVGDARTPLRYSLGVIPMGRQSSAYGYAQALDGTWDEYLKSSGNRGAKRDNIADATDFMGWYMNRTTEKLGIPKTDARNQYLAYHEGWTGYSRGSYKSKSWLVRVAGTVDSRSDMYKRQLQACGKL